MHAEKNKKDQVGALIHPDVTKRMNNLIEKRMWTISRFVEDAIVRYCEELENQN